jgi:TerC family integral membrane protein
VRDITTMRWAVTIALIVVLLAVDLGIAAMRPHAVSLREATISSVAYVAVAILFGLQFWAVEGAEAGTQYFAGYLVEKSLSVDNLFVFVVIMTTFAVPQVYQQKALVIGIIMALMMRAVFIALGAALLDLFSFMFLIFGVALMITAVQLYRHRDADPDVQNNGFVRLARRALPVTDDYEQGTLLTRRDGRRAVTPLLLVLIAIGSTDLLFAFDSIPAVFGVTSEPYIVFTANAFALLGLRALYFLVQGLLDRLVYLSTGLAVILAFIGVKLVLHWGHGLNDAVPEVSTIASLVVILAVLAVTTAASLIASRRHPDQRAHAGSLRRSPSEQAKQEGNTW